MGVVACSFSLAISSTALAASTNVGPQGGGVYHVQADPASVGLLYASGPYRSLDDGQTWTKLPYGISPDLILATGPQAAYAVGLDCVSLYRSMDHGQTWQATGYVTTNYRCITAMTMTASPNARLLIGNADGEILTSDDDGASFYLSMNGLPTGSGFNMTILAASPYQPGLVLAAAGSLQLIYRSVDAGFTWMPADPVSGSSFGAIAFGANNVVYRSGLGEKLLRSANGGLNWSICPNLPSTLESIAVDAQASNALYFIDDDVGHLYVSTDDCATATDISDGFTLDGQSKPYASGVAISAQSGDVLLATEVGIFRRSGSQWLPQNDGVHATPIRSLWIDPHSNGRVFAGFGDGAYSSPGIFRSDDAGASWTTSNHGLFAASVRALVADPTTTANAATTILYATGTSSWDEDSQMMHAGLWKSVDGGTSWTPTEVGIPSGSFGPYLNVVRALVLDPRSCANPPPAPAPCQEGPLQTAYAVSAGDWSSHFLNSDFRIIKTQDGGASWIDIDGLPGPVAGQTTSPVTPVALVIDPQNPQRLFVGTSVSGSTTSIQNGVFRSDDSGATWNLSSSGLPLAAGSTDRHEDVYALAIDPDHPSTLWAATLPKSTSAFNASHVYKSVDAGASWIESDMGITAGDIRQIVVDRRTTPPMLYAAALDVGIYRSVDGGTTWRSISVGLPLTGASAVAVDPSNPARLYVGTSSGVSIVDQEPDADADGAPDEIEQAAPNNGDANDDGVADWQQPNVAVAALSAGSTQARETTRNPGSDGLVAVEVTPDVAGTCGQIVDAQRIDPSDRPLDADHGVNYDHVVAAVRFEVLDCPAATVRLIYSAGTFDSSASLRFFGPLADGTGPRWAAMAAHLPSSGVWAFHLTAGQSGSWRPTQAGSILFEGGPANSERIFRDGFDGFGQ